LAKLQDISNLIEYHSYYFFGRVNTIEFSGRVKKQIFVYKFKPLDFIKEKKKLFNDIHETLSLINKEE